MVVSKPVIISKSRSRCQNPVRNYQIPQKPKSGLKGHGCSLHLENIDREPNFGAYEYQRQVTISKSRLRCQPQSGTSRILKNPKSGPKVHGCFFAPSKSR